MEPSLARTSVFGERDDDADGHSMSFITFPELL
jgi:hypothetical protein